MLIVSAAAFANKERASQLFSGTLLPDKTLVLTDGEVAPDVLTAGDAATAGVVDVTYFSANRVVVKVRTDGPGWLYYADAFHPAWKATVDSAPARVFPANLGFKAVAVEGGESEVVFYFDDGWRNWGRVGLFGFAMLVGFILLGCLLVSCLADVPWRWGDRPTASADIGVREPAAPARDFQQTPTPDDNGAIGVMRLWCGWSLAASLGCTLWFAFGLNLLVLVLQLIVSLGVFARIFRATPPAAGADAGLKRGEGDGTGTWVCLTVLLIWVWQTGPTLDFNLFLMMMILGYLIPYSVHRYRVSSSFPPGKPPSQKLATAQILTLGSLLLFLVSIGCSWWVDHEPAKTVAGASLAQVEKRGMKQEFVRESFERSQGEPLQETLERTENDSEGQEEVKDRFSRSGPFHEHILMCYYRKNRQGIIVLDQALALKNSRWTNSAFAPWELIVWAGPAALYCLCLVLLYLRNRRLPG